MSNNPEKKGVSAIDFFCIGFGAIVGVGWAVSINGWMTSCGGPVPAGIGYIVALIMMEKLRMAVKQTGIKHVAVAGGVSANNGLRNAFRFRIRGFHSLWRAFPKPFF